MTPTTLFTPFFFFNDTATTEIYTLSLHDALPIYLPTGGKTISSVGGTAGVRADIEDLSVVVNGYIGKGVGTTFTFSTIGGGGIAAGGAELRTSDGGYVQVT